MDPFIGQLMLFGFNFAPRGWAQCNGQLLPISQNSALFSLLGTTYGGDGRTTFALPDLRGRAAINSGAGPGLSNYAIGQVGGTESVTLTQMNMPAHNHAAVLNVSEGAPTTTEGTGALLGEASIYTSAAVGGAMKAGAVTTVNTGGSQSHNNMQPYLGMNYCIALVGIFPSRS